MTNNHGFRVIVVRPTDRKIITGAQLEELIEVLSENEYPSDAVCYELWGQLEDAS